MQIHRYMYKWIADERASSNFKAIQARIYFAKIPKFRSYHFKTILKSRILFD